MIIGRSGMDLGPDSPDLGMAGPVYSILSVKPEQSVPRFLGAPKRTPYVQAPGLCKIEGALFEIDESTGNVSP